MSSFITLSALIEQRWPVRGWPCHKRSLPAALRCRRWFRWLQNILLGAGGRAKIADVGLAQLLDREEGQKAARGFAGTLAWAGAGKGGLAPTVGAASVSWRGVGAASVSWRGEAGCYRLSQGRPCRLAHQPRLQASASTHRQATASASLPDCQLSQQPSDALARQSQSCTYYILRI